MIEQARRRRSRSFRPMILIGLEAFGRLRGIQAVMPQPRLDMRYFVEGSIELLGAHPQTLQRWLRAARDELARELGGQTQGGGERLAAQTGGDDYCDATERGDREVAASGAGGQLAAATGIDGHQAIERAEAAADARTHGAPTAPNARRLDCKSLLLSPQAFERLRAIQGTTRHPRLELRYLVDGAVALLHEDTNSHAAWVQQSRQALAMHLSQLQNQPQPLSNLLEIKT